MPTPDLAGIAILAGIPLFAYLGYQRPTTKTMAGRLSFWMAILLFSSPVMMMIYTSVFVSNEAQGTAEEAGAAIGGTVLIGAAFVIGLPLGIAFYLLSNRWDLDDA